MCKPSPPSLPVSTPEPTHWLFRFIAPLIGDAPFVNHGGANRPNRDDRVGRGGGIRGMLAALAGATEEAAIPCVTVTSEW
jgi:hypothetical protein